MRDQERLLTLLIREIIPCATSQRVAKVLARCMQKLASHRGIGTSITEDFDSLVEKWYVVGDRRNARQLETHLAKLGNLSFGHDQTLRVIWGLMSPTAGQALCVPGPVRKKQKQQDSWDWKEIVREEPLTGCHWDTPIAEPEEGSDDSARAKHEQASGDGLSNPCLVRVSGPASPRYSMSPDVVEQRAEMRRPLKYWAMCPSLVIPKGLMTSNQSYDSVLEAIRAEPLKLRQIWVSEETLCRELLFVASGRPSIVESLSVGHYTEGALRSHTQWFRGFSEAYRDVKGMGEILRKPLSTNSLVGSRIRDALAHASMTYLIDVVEGRFLELESWCLNSSESCATSPSGAPSLLALKTSLRPLLRPLKLTSQVWKQTQGEGGDGLRLFSLLYECAEQSRNETILRVWFSVFLEARIAVDEWAFGHSDCAARELYSGRGSSDHVDFGRMEYLARHACLARLRDCYNIVESLGLSIDFTANKFSLDTAVKLLRKAKCESMVEDIVQSKYADWESKSPVTSLNADMRHYSALPKVFGHVHEVVRPQAAWAGDNTTTKALLTTSETPPSPAFSIQRCFFVELELKICKYTEYLLSLVKPRVQDHYSNLLLYIETDPAYVNPSLVSGHSADVMRILCCGEEEANFVPHIFEKYLVPLHKARHEIESRFKESSFRGGPCHRRILRYLQLQILKTFLTFVVENVLKPGILGCLEVARKALTLEHIRVADSNFLKSVQKAFLLSDKLRTLMVERDRLLFLCTASSSCTYEEILDALKSASRIQPSIWAGLVFEKNAWVWAAG